MNWDVYEVYGETIWTLFEILRMTFHLVGAGHERQTDLNYDDFDRWFFHQSLAIRKAAGVEE